MRLPARLAAVAAAGGVLIGWAAPAQPAAAVALASLAGPAGVHAPGAAVENAATGRLLWSRGLDTKRPMASITKVMTALVVIRAGGLGREVRVPAAAVSYVQGNGASSAGLHAGDWLTTQQLLEALLLPSGCDAAYVLASAYGPGLSRFMAKMNTLAWQMGLGRTHFSSFDGLPWPTGNSTYSTPADLLAIGRAAMTSAVFRAIVDQRTYRLGAGSGHHAYYWQTSNMLLGSYPGAIGIKTGWTGAAGYCLLFEARRGSRSLIGIVLDSSATSRWASFSDAGQILNWAFR